MLEDPTVIEGVRVPHLIHRVRPSDEQRQGSG